MMWYWGSGVHWWGWFLMAFGTIVFWAVVVWALVALARWVRDGGGPLPAGRDAEPEQILARRFATGEIDEAEYRSRLEVLRGQERAETG